MVPLEADELPHAVAVSRGGTHAWMIAKGNAVNSSDGDLQLLEWTGMRWRYRKDALPKGISPKDIVALTATSSGAYFGVTRTQLLVYDGARFLAQPVPKGFEPERLLGTDQAGLWVFGPNQVWRYREGVWHSIGVPILHAAAEWLSPTGDLWISGSNINVWQAIHDSDPIDLSAAAAQMVRLVPLPAPKAPR